MSRTRILTIKPNPSSLWWFQYQEDLGYWVLCFAFHHATIPLVSCKMDNDFYLTHGWNISKDQWEEVCELALTLKLLVDPFRNGEHMEDAVL